MAKFVLAGKSDCPHFAKAELLSDALQGTLPDFRVHKISILPQEWKEWLEATCKRNGWKYENSPLIWREVVERGGRGLLLGGFSEFLEHCQDYYNITSDMTSELMQRVAAENLETRMKLCVEEQQRSTFIKAHHVWITGALSSTSYFLIPNLLSTEVFPHAAAVCVHLLELDGSEEELQSLKMEMEDLALSLLHQVSIYTNLDQAFHKADVILLLDEHWMDDSEPDEDGGEKVEESQQDKKVKKISELYTEYGRLIDMRANKEVKVIVGGDSFINARCLILADTACSIDSDQFVAASATQLENEARAIIARRLRVMTSDVTGVTVWGNISGGFYTDLQRAQVFSFSGAITGPAFFSQSLHKIFHDRKWLQSEFQDLVRCERALVSSKTGRAAAMSATHGILTILRAWNGNCGPNQVFSLGIVCPGLYGVPEAVVLSVPVSFSDCKWSVLFNLDVSDELKRRLQVSATELRQEKKDGSKMHHCDNRLGQK